MAPTNTLPTHHNLTRGKVTQMKRKQQKGFSLIELLIVVAIILIISAIAIPSLLRSKVSANNASAAASARSYVTGVMNYVSSHNQPPATASLMGGAETGTVTATKDGELNSALATALDTGLLQSGYTFTYKVGTGTPPSTFDVTAIPNGANGSDSYCADATGTYHTGTTTGTAATGAGCFADSYTLVVGQ